jgi:putative molybdopterin biosynthesis protein
MNSKRNIYLKKKTLAEARQILLEHFPSPEILSSESVEVTDAVSRVLAEPVFAKISSPNFHAAAMDGVAVRAQDTFGASETRSKCLVVNKEAFFVNTGHVLPEGTNAVIMIEDVNIIDNDHLEIEGPAFPWQHVRKMGEDIVATELLFPQNHMITPYCVGALISGGVYSVNVKKRPEILIIPTGSELVDWRNISPEQLKPGQVLETNSFVLGKLAEACGAKFTRHKEVMDDVEHIKTVVKNAIQEGFHIILTIGGSSAGSEDYSNPVISDLGKILVHGITMMPGKPLIIGDINNQPVFGIPGFPVSAILAFEQFVAPLVRKMLNQPEIKRSSAKVYPTRKIASKLGVEEFIRVKLGQVGERIVATSLPRGAGMITSITQADGIIRISNNSEGIDENEPISAELLRPLSSIKNTIVVVGSHDNSLDILANQLKATHSQLTLSSSHVGSMGGLMAIKRGVCHLAGSHLLDIRDGSYNISYIKRYLPGISVKLINLVFREQGIMVLPGNPKGIKGIEDLGRDDVAIINRQKGSGTRILLDYRLEQLGIDPAGIKGYENDEFTHMSVAAAVLSGRADLGLGIFAAAKALGLDFIPVVTEQYDLVIPTLFFETKNIQILIDTIKTNEFKSQVEALGGYDTRMTGEEIQL